MQRWQVRAAVRGADGFDVHGFLPRLFAEELPHLEAEFIQDPVGVLVLSIAVAPDADAAARYVEGRITASLRKRQLPWITTVLDVTPAPTPSDGSR